jgi:hypothetical protein
MAGMMPYIVAFVVVVAVFHYIGTKKTIYRDDGNCP